MWYDRAPFGNRLSRAPLNLGNRILPFPFLQVNAKIIHPTHRLALTILNIPSKSPGASRVFKCARGNF